MRRTWAAASAACGLLVIAASAGSAPAGPPVKAAPSPAKPTNAPKPAAPSNVQLVDGMELKKAVAALKGKVVVLNLWATWCEPCVEEFPFLVKLHNTYAAKGLVVVAVSIDDPEDHREVVSFIQEQKARFPVYVRKRGSIEQFVQPVDRTEAEAVPTTYILGRDGKAVGKPIIGPRTYAQFEATVKPLLK